MMTPLKRKLQVEHLSIFCTPPGSVSSSSARHQFEKGTHRQVVVVLLELSHFRRVIRVRSAVDLGDLEFPVDARDLLLDPLARSDLGLGLRDAVGEERVELSRNGGSANHPEPGDGGRTSVMCLMFCSLRIVSSTFSRLSDAIPSWCARTFF